MFVPNTQRTERTQVSAATLQLVYDTLFQANRKQLSALLGTVVKILDVEQVDMVLAEARKIGAMVWEESKSSFQTRATPKLLDLCFAFLERNELVTAERVCSRWRVACRDGCAGWAAQLVTQGEAQMELDSQYGLNWKAPSLWPELAMARRISPSLVKIRSLNLEFVREPDGYLAEWLSKLAHLDSAVVTEHSRLVAFPRLPNLTSVSFHGNAIGYLRDLTDQGLATQVTKLEFVDWNKIAAECRHFSRLNDLSLVALGSSEPLTWERRKWNCNVKRLKLESFRLDKAWFPGLRTAMPNLEALNVCKCTFPSDQDQEEQSPDLSELGRGLTELKLLDNYPIDSENFPVGAVVRRQSELQLIKAAAPTLTALAVDVACQPGFLENDFPRLVTLAFVMPAQQLLNENSAASLATKFPSLTELHLTTKVRHYASVSPLYYYIESDEEKRLQQEREAQCALQHSEDKSILTALIKGLLELPKLSDLWLENEYTELADQDYPQFKSEARRPQIHFHHCSRPKNRSSSGRGRGRGRPRPRGKISWNPAHPQAWCSCEPDDPDAESSVLCE